MTSRERVRIALEGGRPDRAPIVPIYDVAYLMKSIGQEVREYCTHDAESRIAAMEASFLRHEVDGIFVHSGTNGDWPRNHAVEKLDGYWMVTHRASGRQYRLMPDGWIAKADGTKIPRPPSAGGVSRVQTDEDVRRVASRIPSADDIEASGRFWPLRHLAQKYPTHHFSFQTGSPMVPAVDTCGGFVEGMVTFATDRPLFRKLLAHFAKVESSFMAPGHKAGADSTWFTSYYMAADTISPRDYAETVFPYELEVCQAARDAGLYVLNWFLGDLMPILDKVMELPLDALVLEQGRKGYTIDPVEIRKRVGPKFCLFGFGLENDYCTFNQERLSSELQRQFDGAGRNGAFVVGTPIMPPNAVPDAVDFYFHEARRIARYV